MISFSRLVGHLLRMRSLAPQDRRLCVRALLVMIGVRLALWLAPRRAFRWCERVADHGAGPRASGGPSAERISWAVQTVSRVVPSATCLVQAATGRILLERNGYRAKVRIGVLKDMDCRLEAHAWTEVDGMIVIGGTGHEKYSRFPDWPRT